MIPQSFGPMPLRQGEYDHLLPTTTTPAEGSDKAMP